MIVLLSEIEEGMSNHEVVGDELLAEVDKAKEGTDFLDLDRSWLNSNAVKCDRIHSKLPEFHDYSEVLYFGDIKLTLLKFQMKVKFGHLLEDVMSSFSMCF